MKRLLRYNAWVAAGFLTFWFLLFATDEALRAPQFLSYVLFSSYVAVFVAFWLASWLALRPVSDHSVGFAILISLPMSLVFLVVGILLIVNLTVGIWGD